MPDPTSTEPLSCRCQRARRRCAPHDDEHHHHPGAPPASGLAARRERPDSAELSARAQATADPCGCVAAWVLAPHGRPFTRALHSARSTSSTPGKACRSPAQDRIDRRDRPAVARRRHGDALTTRRRRARLVTWVTKRQPPSAITPPTTLHEPGPAKISRIQTPDQRITFSESCPPPLSTNPIPRSAHPPRTRSVANPPRYGSPKTPRSLNLPTRDSRQLPHLPS